MKRIKSACLCVLILACQPFAYSFSHGLLSSIGGLTLGGVSNNVSPIGQSVDFSTGFELTVRFSGQYEKGSEDYLSVKMNLLASDGGYMAKYTNYVRPLIAEDDSTYRTTILECKAAPYLFELMRDNSGYYEGNAFDTKIHTLTIRERRVSDNRYIVLHYIDGKLCGNYDLVLADGAMVGVNDLPLPRKGSFEIEGTGTVRVVDYSYKKLDGAKRYFLTFIGLNDNTIKSQKVIYKTNSGTPIENNAYGFDPNAWGYLIIQWTTLNGQQSSIESWGYWPDADVNKICVGKCASLSLDKYLDQDGLIQYGSIFRCEVTEDDYLESINRRNLWLSAPGIYLFTGQKCVSFAASITSVLANSIYRTPMSPGKYTTPTDFISAELNYPHAEQGINLQEMYYPISDKDLTLIEPSSTYVSPIDMSTREGAYMGTLKFKPGTVGYEVNLMIGVIKAVGGSAGEAKIGELFNRPDVQQLLAKENTFANNYKVAQLEYAYWAKVRFEAGHSLEDRIGGEVGIKFSPLIRAGMQILAPYAFDYVDPWLLNIRDKKEQIDAIAAYRIRLLKQYMKEAEKKLKSEK